METILSLTVPDNFCIPWERIVRGALVLAMVVILCFSVQEYTKDLAITPEGNTFIPSGISNETPKIPTPFSVTDRLYEDLIYDPELDLFTAAALVVNKNNPENIVPNTGRDNEKINILSASNDHIKYIIPASNNTENTVFTVDNNNTENMVSSVGDDDIETLFPVIDNDENGRNDSNIYEQETGIITPVTSNHESETKEPAQDITDTELPAVNEETPTVDKIVSATDEEAPTVNEETPAVNEDRTDTETTGTRELHGFLIDEEGYIAGVTNDIDTTDGILVVAWDTECIGIRSNALAELTECLDEIYIPANIGTIEPGTFDIFSSQVYIEVAKDNPYYYSENGILYSK